MVVTPDGKGIYAGDLGGSGGPLYNWTSEDLITYAKTDSIYTNTDAQMIFSTQRTTMDWDRKGRLWVSHDNAYAAGDNSPNGLFVFDFETMEYSFVPCPVVAAGKGNGPRGVAFSVTGDTAYACSFNSSKVWRWIKKTDAVEGNQYVSLPATYELEQNYPNPFNPTTTIVFSLPEKGKVELKIFDNLGREVLTVLNRDLSAGKHSVMFDASKLATGIYHYRLKVNDEVFTRKMTLVK
jgi:DNA-binding beta-propeller fold protein YncE